MTAKRNNLVALSSAAVVAVYAAGYARTRGTTEAFASQPAEVRPALSPRDSTAATPAVPVGLSPAKAGVSASLRSARPAELEASIAPKKERRASAKTSEPMIAMAIVDTTEKEPPAAPIAATPT